MFRQTCRSTAALALAMLLLFTARPAGACGPFSLDAVFTFTAHPEFPLDKFAAGEIGIVQPSFARSYLFVSYRYLSGNGFNQSEQKALVSLWNDRLNYSWPDFDEEYPKPWLAAREKIAGLPPAPKIGTYRRREKPNEYESYLNCQQDAFETAAATLDQRMKKYGRDSALIKDWIAAQDQVFANCSDGKTIPAAAPPEADSLLRADRAYQIAAANFYAGDFETAKSEFAAVAEDQSSPWRTTAAYLIARSWLRIAGLGPAEKKNEALAQSEAQLRKLLDDRGFAAIHPAAKRLLALVRLRLHPEERAHEMAVALVKRNNETLKQDLWDYTVLLDQLVGDDSSDSHKVLSAELQADDLTDWIDTIETAGPEALDHALQRWQGTSSLPWLVAALGKVKPNHPQAAALLSAAAKVDPAAPAYASTVFHQIKLALEAGKFAEARSQLDALLVGRKHTLPVSSLNLFLSLRMRLAKNLTEFLTYSQRQPAALSYNDDGREQPADLSEDSELKELSGRTFFDVDGRRSFNERLPTSVLLEAAESKALPVHLRRDVAQAAWLRAALLDQPDTARALVPTLKALFPEMKPLLEDYQGALTEASKFSAIYVWLKTPGFQPVVTSGIGRRTPLNEQDSLRDNWWCGAAFRPEPAAAGEEEKTESVALAVSERSALQSPAFLTVAQKTAARDEYRRLMALGSAPNYLCRQVIQWAASHPDDPRVPESLHLAVRTTRYGCTDKESGRWSKAAFDLLHRRYANNEWTKKTPYWFKD